MVQPRSNESGATSVPRSSSACYACRARKQKCDGQRPTCSRCRSLSQTCVWPRKQKRGPAKGYIEALETRLKETERLLWRMLSTSNANLESLSEAFTGDLDHQIPANLSISTLSTTEEKKSAIAYWEQFPLQTPEDVIVWKQDLDSLSGAAATGSSIVVDNTLFERLEVASPSDPSPFEGSFSGDPSPIQDTRHEATDGVPGHDGMPLAPENRSLARSASSQAPGNVGDTSRQFSSRPHRSSTAAKFGLSQEFEDTFLW